MSTPYLTLTQFRATGRDVNDQELAQATGQGIDSVSPDGGRVYAGDRYIELDGHNKWFLTLGNRSWYGELKTLEASLYAHAREDGIMDAPPDEEVAFIEEWLTFCRDEGLPDNVSADEMNTHATLNTEQYSYVQNFIRRLDEWSDGRGEEVYKPGDLRKSAEVPTYQFNKATEELMQGLVTEHRQMLAALRQIAKMNATAAMRDIANKTLIDITNDSMEAMAKTHVGDFFQDQLGETLQLDDEHQKLVSQFTLDTVCGESCAFAIDATKKFLQYVSIEPTALSRAEIIDECRQAVTVFMFG